MRGAVPAMLIAALLGIAPAHAAEGAPPEGEKFQAPGVVAPAGGAPPIQVTVTADRKQATVGDPILIRIEVSHPPGVTILPPLPAGKGEENLVLEPVTISPDAGGKGAEGSELSTVPGSPELHIYRAQAFETGTVTLPAFRVDWSREGGESGSVTTDPIPVEILSVLTGPDEKPSDLKPPADLPRPPFPWFAAFGALLLALTVAAALLAWRRSRRKGAEAPATSHAPEIPPHEQAYRDLERLLASGLLEAGKVKEFHVELGEIGKRYLKGRFAIETLERTSGEVLEDLRRVRIGMEPLGAARALLSDTDLVKFARHLPDAAGIRRTVDETYRLVDLTRVTPASLTPAAVSPPPGLSPEGAG